MCRATQASYQDADLGWRHVRRRAGHLTTGGAPPMPEAVIVSAARSPIGRANKGSLKDLRPDDLTRHDRPGGAGQDPRARPERHRRPRSSAAACPAARRGNNMGRDRRGAARLRDPRHDDHPLLLLVGADHPDGLPRDQGRRGRRVHLRRRRDGLPLRQGHLRPPPRHPQPGVRGRQGPHRRVRAGRHGLARPARGRPRSRTSTSRWARPPRTSPGCAASPARSSTSSASAARTSPRRRSTTASGPARSPR